MITIAQAHKQETSYAQVHKQDTSNKQELHISNCLVEHLIYNQWCSQYKTVQTLDLRISKI